MAKNKVNQWDPDFLNKSLIFSDLKLLLKNKNWPAWPGCQELMSLLDEPVTFSSNKILTMNPQDDSLPFAEMGYEEGCNPSPSHQKGIVLSTFYAVVPLCNH